VVGSQRGQGIGSELVQAGMKVARDQGYERVYAITTAAVGILERLGWEFVKTVVYQDGEHSLYGCKLYGARASCPPAATRLVAFHQQK
jgi:N-acetylglutamate synthase-like GNAT family acetyltransferase